MRSENLFSFNRSFENITIENYFLEMLKQEAVCIAKPFLNNESEIILELIQKYSMEIFLGIGCGSGLYSDLIIDFCQYLGIDPLYDLTNDKKSISIIKNTFENVHLKRKHEKHLISFLFNLISYVDTSQVINFLNQNTKAGDIITISTWNTNPAAQRLRNKYFQHITKDINLEFSHCLKNYFDIEKRMTSEIKNYKAHELVELPYIKMLIVYL